MTNKDDTLVEDKIEKSDAPLYEVFFRGHKIKFPQTANRGQAPGIGEFTGKDPELPAINEPQKRK